MLLEKSLFCTSQVWQQFVGEVGTFIIFALSSSFTMMYILKIIKIDCLFVVI